MTNQYINGVFKAIDNQDLLANKIEGNEQRNSIPANLKPLPLTVFPFLPYNILGIDKPVHYLIRHCKIDFKILFQN
jgi:hypothetical protein